MGRAIARFSTSDVHERHISLFFLIHLLFFSQVSSISPHFLTKTGTPGERLADPGRPRLDLGLFVCRVLHAFKVSYCPVSLIKVNKSSYVRIFQYPGSSDSFLFCNCVNLTHTPVYCPQLRCIMGYIYANSLYQYSFLHKVFKLVVLKGSRLAKMKKYIPYMSLS